MTRIDAANANAAIPETGGESPIQAVIGVAKKVIQVTAADMAEVMGKMADALPGIGGYFGFEAQRKEMAKDWKTIRNYLSIEVEKESKKPSPNKERLELLKTAHSGAAFHYGGLMHHAQVYAKDIPTLNETMEALVKLGNPEFAKGEKGTAECAKKLEPFMRAHRIEALKAEIERRSAQLSVDAKALERDRIALDQEKKDFSGVGEYTLSTLQSEPFDNFQSDESLTTFEKSIALAEEGTPARLRDYIFQLQKGLSLEKPKSKQAEHIRSALTVFKETLFDAEGKCRTAKPEMPVSFTEACTILLKVRAKLETSLVKKYDGIRQRSMELATRANELEMRGEALRFQGWGITKLDRELSDLLMLERVEAAKTGSGSMKDSASFGASVHEDAEKLDAESAKAGSDAIPSVEKIKSVEEDHEKTEEKLKDHEKPKL